MWGDVQVVVGSAGDLLSVLTCRVNDGLHDNVNAGTRHWLQTTVNKYADNIG